MTAWTIDSRGMKLLMAVFPVGNKRVEASFIFAALDTLDLGGSCTYPFHDRGRRAQRPGAASRRPSGRLSLDTNSNSTFCQIGV